VSWTSFVLETSSSSVDEEVVAAERKPVDVEKLMSLRESSTK